MSPAAAPDGPPTRSPKPLFDLVQFYMIQAFNEANEDKEKENLVKCWPLFQVDSPSKEDQFSFWMLLVLTDAHEKFPNAKDSCRIRIGKSWFEATRVNNPVTSIRAEDIDHHIFATYKVRVPRSTSNGKQAPWVPAEMTRDTKDGRLAPILNHAQMFWATLHLTAVSTPELIDQVQNKPVPHAARSFLDAKHYHDIYRWGAEKEFEFEKTAVREFNRTSVFKCWLILRYPNEEKLYQAGQDDSLQQECLVVVDATGQQEGFPKVGDLCDLGFSAEMPALDKKIVHTKDNFNLMRHGVRYFRGTRLDNAPELFSLDDRSVKGPSWKGYSTFKVSVHRKPSDPSFDYNPFESFKCKLDHTEISRREGGSPPQLRLDEGSCFSVHLWVDISETTISVERHALRAAMSQPLESRVGKALSYIRTFSNKTEKVDLFEVFPHMHPDDPDSVLPENVRALFKTLDDDQKHVYRTLLSSLPARVGIIHGGPGTGKTALVLAICAMALANHVPRENMRSAMGQKGFSTGGPLLLIVEANRPANTAANRVMAQFEALGRSDLRIVRAYNLNYEGKWGTRRYFKTHDDKETPTGFDFDECFPAHRADHIPQVRRGLRTDCLAPTLREEAQRYLADHAEEFPLTFKLLTTDPKKMQSNNPKEAEGYKKEWDALFVAVLARTDLVVTTPVGAAKIDEYFRPKIVIFSCASRARELSSLVAVANFPSAEAWLFFGTVETTKPFVTSYGNRSLWNPCGDQLRTSMMERHLHVSPDAHRLKLNHQAYGDLHALSSHLFFDGQLDSALPSSQRFPPSTLHLLEYFRGLAKNPSLAVPRLLVHMKGSPEVAENQKSKMNYAHREWVLRRVIRHFLKDKDFRSTDGTEPGSIIVISPYKAQSEAYRKEIRMTLRDLDKKHRRTGGIGEMLHRQVLVDAMTADTCQGHSADLVVFDLVNSELTSHVNDPNRLCVALSRAVQAEIILMETSMLQAEGPRKEYGPTNIDSLYDHCKSQGQVTEADMVDDDSVHKGYTPHWDNERVGRDVSAVPRSLLSLPASLSKSRGNRRPNTTWGTIESDVSARESDGPDHMGGAW